MKNTSVIEGGVSFSQFGEDRILLEYFESIGISRGIFLEIGANHPTQLSQTWLLEQNGWTGFLIEPLPEMAAMLTKQRPNSKVFESAVSSAEKRGQAYLIVKEDQAESELVFDRPTNDCAFQPVPVRTIDDVLSEAGCQRIDFLSIDIEGMEIPALTAFDFDRYRPALILIEDHCQDLTKHRFLTSKGYKVVNRCGCNNWYILRNVRYSGKRTISRYELYRKLFLGLPFRILRNKFKSR